MITASELRIGNYVYSDKENAPTPIKINRKIMQYLCKNNDFHLLEPIPLTEEILLKCGFKRLRYDMGAFAYLKDGMFDIVFYGDAIPFIEINEIRKDLKHLHKLQNLYFELTNEELKIEL